MNNNHVTFMQKIRKFNPFNGEKLAKTSILGLFGHILAQNRLKKLTEVIIIPKRLLLVTFMRKIKKLLLQW